MKSLKSYGKYLEKQFDDIHFIGIQEGLNSSIYLFNDKKTGATFCGNDIESIKNKLNYIRNNIKELDEIYNK